MQCEEKELFIKYRRRKRLFRDVETTKCILVERKVIFLSKKSDNI